ncbi:MAG: helix-turn-helix domain-containing protein [candidate division WOR-3 bacterium]|nr:helix-turn-helix domain-containing protein [candidate division WOR-3 bacterium]
MLKNIFLGKEIGQLLRKSREKSRLSQTEVAERIGLSSKTGHGYLSRLESGKVKSPPLYIILLYLRACGESWAEFFKHLDAIDFRTRHEKMTSLLPIPPDQRKIQRDAMRYEIGIEFPSKEKPKRDIDFDRLKSRIETKITPFLIKNDIEGNQASLYQKFTREYFDFMATLNKSGMKAVIERYQRAGLKNHLLNGLKKIIIKVIQAEIKRIKARKPLPTEKQEKMAIGFTKYRIRIEKIEAEVHKLLCALSVPTTWFGMYKAFSRECYRVLKRFYGKEILSDKFQAIIRRWVKEGLKEDILLKVKEVTIKVFTSKNV